MLEKAGASLLSRDLTPMGDELANLVGETAPETSMELIWAA